MKTDFSDWLIVSDVDGTLNTKLRMLPNGISKPLHILLKISEAILLLLPEEIYLRSESIMSACR